MFKKIKLLNPKTSNHMNLIRYRTNDYAPVSFSNLVDQFFGDTVSRTGGSTFYPKTDVAETDKAYEIHLAVPGLKKEDFALELNENFLTISGERKFNEEKKEKNFHSVETYYGSFSRSFRVPENVEASKITAAYVNGILEVTLPKDEKKVLKASIKVN
jgi:HSP20 family protein